MSNPTRTPRHRGELVRPSAQTCVRVEHVCDYAVEVDEGAERLLPAPLNAVAAPPGKDRKHGRAGAGALVLACFVWPTRVTIVPAVAVWFSDDRTCVEWRVHSTGRTRLTWLPRDDVRRTLNYPRQ